MPIAFSDAIAVVPHVDIRAPLVEHDPGDGRAASSCWAGDAPGTPPQRIEVCVDDDDDAPSRLRWTTESSAGLVGVTTVTLTPPE